VWELSHDFIAAAIARYLGHRRRNFRRLAGYLTPASLLLAASLTYAWDRDDPLVLMPPRQEPIAFLAGPQPTDSISGASLSFVNGAKIQQDPVLKRNAFYFPGNGAMVTLNIPQLPSGNRERTIALWAYATRDPGISGAEAFLAGYGGFRDSGDTYDVYARDGGAISLSNWGDAVTVPGFTLNRWICVAAVTRPAGSSRAVDTIYLQDEQNSLDMPTNTAASQTFFVGGHDRGRTLFGYIRDVAVFDVALSKRNIAYLCHHPDWEPKGG
jgi:hypothetical protein